MAYGLNLKAGLMSLHSDWSHNTANICNIINIDYGSSSIWCYFCLPISNQYIRSEHYDGSTTSGYLSHPVGILINIY